MIEQKPRRKRGRPEGELLVDLHVRITPDMRDQIDALCGDVPRNTFIRRLLEDGIERMVRRGALK